MGRGKLRLIINMLFSAHVNFLFFILSSVLLLSSCKDESISKQLNKRSYFGSTTEATVKSDEDGVVVASIDPNSGTRQSVKASSDSGVAGSEIVFPPGALSVATDISVEEGVPLTGSGSDLGIDSEITAKSSTLVITPDQQVDAQQPMTIAINTGSNLHLNGKSGLTQSEHLIVLYQIFKAGSGEYFLGVIPTKDLTVSGSLVKFETKFFGAFQVASVPTAIEKSVEKNTDSAPTTKSVAEKAPFELTSVSPYVVNEGDTVNLVGKNFRKGITLAMGDTRSKLTVKSDVAATFVMPKDQKFGFVDASIEQDGKQEGLKLFALAGKSGLPLITLSTDGVCSGVKYIDAEGKERTGSKSCDSTSNTLDKDGDGKADKAKVADSATQAGSADEADHADTADHADSAGYATGSQGADIASASTLSLPSSLGGSYFKVTGNADISGISSKDAGTRITLQFTEALTLSNTLTGNLFVLKNFKNVDVRPGDILEFISLGAGKWKEVGRHLNDTNFDIIVSPVANQNIANNSDGVTIVLGDTEFDRLGEYDDSGSKIVVNENGSYKFELDIRVVDSDFGEGSCSSMGVSIEVMKNNASYGSFMLEGQCAAGVFLQEGIESTGSFSDTDEITFSITTPDNDTNQTYIDFKSTRVYVTKTIGGP